MKRLGFVIVIVTNAACGSVPDLRFVDDAGPPMDARAPDSATLPGPDASVQDSGACSAPPPAGATACCGRIWCVGAFCDEPRCAVCATCEQGMTCCPNNGQVKCKPQC